MSLHLLHHKDWHVWKKDNLAQVAKDEKEHKEKEDAEKRRKIGVEREARYERLSKKKKLVEQSFTTETGNVNFFSDIEKMIEETGETGVKPNPEYLKEKKESQEKLERFATSYLGQGSIETQKEKPWWFTGEAPNVDEKKAKRDAATKKSEDPFSNVEKLIEIKKREQPRQTQPAKSKKRTRQESSESDDSDNDKDRKKKEIKIVWL